MECPFHEQFRQSAQHPKQRLHTTEKYDRSKIVTAVGNHGDEDINRFTGKQLYDVLKDKYLLQPEMASGSYVVLMLSLIHI